MAANYHDLFKHLSTTEVPSGLRSAIINKLTELDQRGARQRLAVFVGSALISLAGLIPTVNYLFGLFTESGFYQYLSLISSDSSTLALVWKELILSLAESLPALGLAVLLTLVVIFVWSTGRALRDVRQVFLLA